MYRQAGFTLLELLIALTLMGLLLAMLYGGLHIGNRSWNAGEQRAEQFNELRIVHDFIRRQIRQSLALFHITEDGRVLAFTGETERLRIVTPMLQHLGRGGLYFVEFDVVASDPGDLLRMRWQPFHPGREDGERLGDDSEEPEDTILLSGVEDVKWSYFGQVSVGEDPEWSDKWENLTQLPMLLRLNLNIRGEPWPDLVVRVFN